MTPLTTQLSFLACICCAYEDKSCGYHIVQVKAVQAVYGAMNCVDGGGCECVLVWNGGLSKVFSSKPLDLAWQRITSRCSTLCVVSLVPLVFVYQFTLMFTVQLVVPCTHAHINLGIIQLWTSYIYMHIPIHPHIYSSTHPHTHTHIHTHTHAYTHTGPYESPLLITHTQHHTMPSTRGNLPLAQSSSAHWRVLPNQIVPK